MKQNLEMDQSLKWNKSRTRLRFEIKQNLELDQGLKWNNI